MPDDDLPRTPAEAARPVHAAPLVVDVTWYARAEGVVVPMPDEVRPYALGLYASLRRPIEADAGGDPDAGRVRVGIPVQLGRPLGSLATELAAATDGRAAARVVVPILDRAAWDTGGDLVRRALSDLAALARHGGAVALVPVVLDLRWSRVLADPIVAARDGDPQVAIGVVMRVVAARVAQWLLRRNPLTSTASRIGFFVGHDARRPAPGRGVVETLRGQVARSKLRDYVEVIDLGTPDATARMRARPGAAVCLSVRGDRDGDDDDATHALLMAKELQVPCLALWLGGDERRASPYGGNTPMLSWDPRRADDVVMRGLQAWLHHVHFVMVGRAMLALADLARASAVVSRPPELVDLATGALPADDDCVVLYPDPPVPVAEARILRLAQPRIRLATPMTLLAGRVVRDDPAPPLAHRAVALSFDDGTDVVAAERGAHVEGYTRLHVDEVLGGLARSLAHAGARVDRASDAVTGTGPQRDARPGTSARPRGTGARRDGHAGATRDGRAGATRDAAIDRTGGHADIIAAPDATADAWIALGGERRDYAGRYPAHPTACLAMLDAGKPVYVLAGFGGAARLAADALLGNFDAWPDEALRRARDPAWAARADAHDRDRLRDGRGPSSLVELALRLSVHGAELHGPDHERWRNGLTVQENKRLFASRDLEEISHLVLKGLIHTLPRHAPGEARTRMRCHLFHGALVDLVPIQAYAVTLVEGPALDRSAAALDARIGQQIDARARTRGHAVERIDAAGRLPGRAVYVATLGRLADVEPARRRLTSACIALARMIDADKIEHLAVANLGAPLGLGAVVAAETLLAALDDRAPHLATITFCEEDPQVYELLRASLRDAEALPASPASISREGGLPAPVTIEVRHSGDQLVVAARAPSDAAATVELAAHPIALGPHRAWVTELVAGDARMAPHPRRQDALGRALSEHLLSARARDLLRAHPTRPVDLILDAQAAGLPWELLAIEAGDDAPPLVPALAGGVRRRLLVEADAGRPARRIAPGDHLSVLLVVDPTLGSADAEANAIADRLAARPALEICVLRGADATLAQVRRELATERWQVLHYAGHATFDADDRGRSGLLLCDGDFTAAELAPDTSMPPLVVFNACESARVRGPATAATRRGVARGPAPADEGLARAVLSSGVRTFVGTFWRVQDDDAADFAAVLYDRLFAGATAGSAVIAARKALRAGPYPSRDWANYTLYGDTELRF